MTKYRNVARIIEQRIAEQRLGPGDSLPSERQLAGELGVAYGTARLAYDYLYRRGIIDRQQGRGTFIADPHRDNPPQRCGRLGVLAVEMGGGESPFLRKLTYEIQRLAAEADFELTIDQLNLQDVATGRLPAMIRKRSVDGYFIYGRVKDFHIRLLDEHPLPYILVGNRPVPADTPQVTYDIQSLVHQVTRHLIDAGRRPVWLDADPAKTSYEVGLQSLRGYQQAIEETASHQPRLCPLALDRLDQAVEELAGHDLSRGAFIVQDWSAVLLRASLLQRHAQARDLWIVPLPHEELCDVLHGPGVATWDHPTSMGDLARPAFERMMAFLRDPVGRPASVRVGMQCDMQVIQGQPRFSLALSPQVIAAAPPSRKGPDPRPLPHADWLS